MMIASPCINICQMDPLSGLCVGCQRTLAEIATWSATDDIERRRILAAIAERRRLAEQASGREACPVY
ncbi:MAG: DUF1289 domain-containing protein [Azonexus sp.]|nr:DUF1289 domain-containing protein [Azonexus sp.]